LFENDNFYDESVFLVNVCRDGKSLFKFRKSHKLSVDVHATYAPAFRVMKTKYFDEIM